MKRFWIVLLSLGLIIAFNTTVFAADAKFAGEFYLQGWYNKNASLLDKDSVGTSTPAGRGSSAFYTQRLRMGIDIDVAKGLKLGTRFDALERKWMAARTAVAPNNGITTTDQEQENIGFEIAYVQFFTPIGIITAGNTIAGQFGTPFNDYVGYDNPIIAYTMIKGPWTMTASLKKSQDGTYNANAAYGIPVTGIGQGTDNDSDSYTLQVQNRWNTGNAGAQFTWVRSRTMDIIPVTSVASPALSFKVDIPFSVLFFRNQFGKVFIEDEVLFVWGAKYRDYNDPARQDIDNGLGLSNYFNINVDLAPVKLGFMFVYSQGDDPTTLDENEGGYHAVLGNDKSFNPCLILFNNDYVNTVKGFGKITGAAGVGLDTYFDNVWFYQVYGDFNITPKLKLGATFSYAYADEKPSATYVDEDYGYEFDATLRYKIFDNLEYMIGAAYLWTGDYFKGTNASVKVDDNYLITHKLTLSF